MGNLFSAPHLIIILLIVLVLFGRGKISEFMGDFAKGINSFKKGLKDDDNENVEETAASSEPVKTIEATPVAAQPTKVKAKAAPRKTTAATKTVARKTTKTKS